MDITTIEALQDGDHKAFEEVFLTYFDKVKYLLTGLLRSESDAEELAQDIFVILEYNLYPFIIRTLGGLSDFEVTNCQPFLLLHSALICFLGISLCHKGNTFLSNMCCVL